MARPISITKDKILAAALDVVRKGGASALTARSLSSALGCGVNPIFSAYGSMEGVLEAVRTQARNIRSAEHFPSIRNHRQECAGLLDGHPCRK